MKIKEIKRVLGARIYCGDESSELEITSACGADLMSDVMAFVKDQVVLLTGLITPQTIRTADLMDIKAVVFVRGKEPTDDMIKMADQAGIALLSTTRTMFISCGLLYEAGLRQHGVRSID